VLHFAVVQLETTAVIDEQQDAILLQDVLRSRTFERTSSLRKLLMYLWEQRNSDINEYAIATEALGRPANFESKIDATVRVQIGRLRRLFDKFYAEEGASHIRRVTIPVWSHQLLFVNIENVPTQLLTTLPKLNRTALEPSATPDPVSVAVIGRPIVPAHIGYGILAAVACCALALTASFFSGWTPNAGHRELPPFWMNLLDNGKNMRIVLPAPIFLSLRTPNGGSLMVRDINVNDPSKWTDSLALTELMGKQQSMPPTWQGYTVASDTFASLQLARFLDGYGIRTSFSSSADSPPEIIDHENVVAFGTKNSLAAYQTDLDRLTFRMAPYEMKVTDLLSAPDHPREFVLVHESRERDVAPGIVALIPRGKDGSRLLLLQGSQTMALIAYLTSDEGMHEIMQATQQMKTPYFEAVILSQVNRGTPLQSHLGAIRPFQERIGGGQI